MRRIFAILVFIIVFSVGVGFSAINNNPVTINYYTGSLTVPVSIVIVLSIILGILIGSSILYLSRLRLLYENRRLQKKLDVLAQEIDNLRAFPLKELD